MINILSRILPDVATQALYRRLLRYVKPYWRYFASALFFMVVFSASQASIPALMKPLLDGTFVQKDAQYLFWAPILLVVLFTVRGLATFLSELAFNWVASKVVFDIRNEMFQRMMQFPTAYYDRHTTGSLVSRITYDANQVTQSANQVLVILVRDTLITLGLLGYIIYLNWRLSITLLILIPFIYYLISLLAKRLRRIHKELQSQYGNMTHILEESIKGHKVIKIFAGQEYETTRFQNASNWLRRLHVKAQVSSSINMPLIETLSAVIMALVIYVSAAPGEDSLTVGAFVSFLTAFVLIMPPIKNLTRINGPMQQGLAAAESIFSMLDEPVEVDSGAINVEKVRGDVLFQSVSFAYPHSEKRALNSVDLVVPAGKTVALVGSSGSGKTTLANLMPRLYNVSDGAIFIDGIDIREMTLASLRRQISYVSQDVVLFNDTVAANIAYGQPQATRESIEQAARSAYAMEFIERMPEGLDTLIGENGLRLSGGQRQRLAIARAILKNAPILILDEATSALDNESERYIQEALLGLMRERTTLVIAHRLSTVENADLILVLQNGCIAEQGRHAELLARKGLYAALYLQHLNSSD